jgi:hypothetical protein
MPKGKTEEEKIVNGDKVEVKIGRSWLDTNVLVNDKRLRYVTKVDLHVEVRKPTKAIIALTDGIQATYSGYFVSQGEWDSYQAWQESVEYIPGKVVMISESEYNDFLDWKSYQDKHER